MAKVYLLCLLLCGFAHADQVNCIKWKDADGATAGTYCKPFTVKAGSGIALSDDQLNRTMTISSTGVAPGAGGSTTQVNFNLSGVLSGSSGLTWNNLNSTLTATHIANFDRRPYVDMLRDCGLVGYPTDDSTAANACFALYPSWAFYFPPIQTDGSCSYWFAAALKPTGEASKLMGASAGYKNSTTKQGGTVLCFAAGVPGIELDLTGQNCSGCQISDLSLLGSEGVGHLTLPNSLNMPASLPQFTRSIATAQRTSNVLTVTTSLNHIEGLTQQVGSTVKISGTSDATVNGKCIIATLTGLNTFSENATGFTCPQNGADTGALGAGGTVSIPTTGTSTADGIRICTNFATIKNVVVANFGRHGINADSLAADAMCPTNFSDDLVIENTVITGNQGDGFYCEGVDCNAGFMHGNPAYYNVLWGIEDQSSLGNTWVGNQISNNGSQWAVTTTPTTKNISSISRTLGTADSVVSVVLASADSNVKVGSCVLIAGVTDATFNNTAGQCYFVTTSTDSTHYTYIQPGAPANASSSGGTSRMAKFSEAYLSAGVDSGAVKIATHTSTYSSPWLGNYIEGGQDCKFGVMISIGGANDPDCATLSTFKGVATIRSVTPGTVGSSTSVSGFANEKDATNSIFFKAGISGGTLRHTYHRVWNNTLDTDSWGWDYDPSGASGTTGSVILSRGTAGSGVKRLSFYGLTNASGITRIGSEGTGAVQVNLDANSGTGGLAVASGGASPAIVSTIDSAGKLTANGGVVINNIAAPTAAANQIAFGSTTASTVGSAGAASALPATPSGYIIVNIAGTNFKIPYFAN